MCRCEVKMPRARCSPSWSIQSRVACRSWSLHGVQRLGAPSISPLIACVASRNACARLVAIGSTVSTRCGNACRKNAVQDARTMLSSSTGSPGPRGKHRRHRLHAVGKGAPLAAPQGDGTQADHAGCPEQVFAQLHQLAARRTARSPARRARGRRPANAARRRPTRRHPRRPRQCRTRSSDSPPPPCVLRRPPARVGRSTAGRDPRQRGLPGPRPGRRSGAGRAGPAASSA